MVLKCESAIMRHEKARKLVSTLKQKHSTLLCSCDGLNETSSNYGLVVGKTCGQIAWDYMHEDEEANYYGITTSFEDAFFNEINDEKGACDSCMEAFDLKRGELMEAKKELGNAKRAISSIGKKLIKEGDL